MENIFDEIRKSSNKRLTESKPMTIRQAINTIMNTGQYKVEKVPAGTKWLMIDDDGDITYCDDAQLIDAAGYMNESISKGKK